MHFAQPEVSSLRRAGAPPRDDLKGLDLAGVVDRQGQLRLLRAM
jgi:hypothetical protein